MNAIQTFAGNVKTAFESIGKSVDGIVSDIESLKKKIEELQNSSGAITPEDQASLDEIQALVNTTSEKLAALDAATESAPTPPPGA